MQLPRFNHFKLTDFIFFKQQNRKCYFLITFSYLLWKWVNSARNSKKIWDEVIKIMKKLEISKIVILNILLRWSCTLKCVRSCDYFNHRWSRSYRSRSRVKALSFSHGMFGITVPSVHLKLSTKVTFLLAISAKIRTSSRSQTPRLNVYPRKSSSQFE